MNRNTKRYPKEEINRLKKSGKRLRGGYVLTRLKNWKKRKATAKRVSVDLLATEIVPPKKSIKRPLKKTIRKQQRTTIPKTKRVGRAIPVNIEKPKQQRTTIPKTKRVGRAIPVNIEKPKQERRTIPKTKRVGRAIPVNIKKPKQERRIQKAKKNNIIENKLIIEAIKKANASDIPAFGDDIREEELELDSKLDLPEIKQERNSMDIASSKDIRTMRFKAMTLPSKYRQLLGKVPSNFRLLLWGAPGHGKSSLALTIANDIGKYVKTLYVSAEESLQSATLASRIKRFKANARNLMFNDSNNPDIIEKIILTQNPKFIVIDSVNVMIGKTEAMINLMLKYPEIGFILIAQATKDRKRYAGLGSLAHAVDIVVNVKSGVATAEKNRYSQLGSMPVKGIKI